MSKLRSYDAGSRFVDRYTVIIGNDVFTMSSDPRSPLGVNQFAGTTEEIAEGPHLGTKLIYVPVELRQAIKNRADEKIFDLF